MKSIAVILAALVLAGLGWFLASPRSPGSSQPNGPEPIPPTATVTDPTDVFQKAFWKRPTPDDQILHAERREWSDAAGLTKWQWFLAVKPGSALVDHLISDNAFGLVRRGPFRLPAQRPGWFPDSGDPYEVFTSVSGAFTLLRDRATNVLYATDSGGGFRPGAPEPRRAPAVQTATAGRLPGTPPPQPPDP